MRKNIVIALLALITLAAIAANNTPGNVICFDATATRHYKTQGYAGYTFKLVGQSGVLELETSNPQHKPGIIICKGSFDYTDNLNKLFPTQGC